MSTQKKVIQIFEWQSLSIGVDGFTTKHYESLLRWQESQEKDFFKVGYKKVTFTQWVGVVQVDSLQIEVLPKAGNSNSHEDWKKVLIQMLRKSGELKLRHSEDTDLSTRKQDLFDLYYQSFLEEVETLLHRGLVKKYRLEEKNRTALKGRLNFQKQISKNLVHKERFYTEASEYDRQNDWNEILLAALRVTGKQVQSGSLRSKAKNLELSFPDWPDRRFTKENFDRLVYDRKTEGYEKAIELAKLILLQLNPQISVGQKKVLAILFDMNKLFESFVAKRLQYLNRQGGSKFDVGVERPRRNLVCIAEQQRELFQMKPDITISQSKELIRIIDTKWKKLNHSDSKYGVKQSDVYQMYAYANRYQCNEITLLYPECDQDLKSLEMEFIEGEQKLKVKTVKLLVLKSKSGLKNFDNQLSDYLAITEQVCHEE